LHAASGTASPKRLRLGEHRARTRPEAVLDDHRAGLDHGVVGLAEHLVDLGEGLLLARGLGPHHAADDARAGLEGADGVGREQHALAQADRVGAQDRVAAGVLERADHAVVTAGHDPDDLAGRLAVVQRAGIGPRHHPVAVPGARELVGGHEQVLDGAVVGDDEPVAPGGDLQAAGEQVHVLRQAVGTPPRADELAGVDQIAEHVAQFRPVLDLQLQLLLHVVDVPGPLGVVTEELQHVLAVDRCHRPRA
jgi:hypothetical protein